MIDVNMNDLKINDIIILKNDSNIYTISEITSDKIYAFAITGDNTTSGCRLKQIFIRKDK